MDDEMSASTFRRERELSALAACLAGAGAERQVLGGTHVNIPETVTCAVNCQSLPHTTNVTPSRGRATTAA